MIDQQIINEYINGESINHLHIKHNVSYKKIKYWLKKLNIPDNHTGRFYQEYEECGDYTKIHIKYKDGYIYCLIDNNDVEKCKNYGIWSIGKNGYIMNCKTGTYIHRFIMDCPNDLEVDHIYHNPLDNRKAMLRISNSSQQKMNTKVRSDNTSGVRGVYYDKFRNTWNVNINFNNQHFRKRYKNKEDAIKASEDIYTNGFGEYRYKPTPNTD